MTPVVNILWLCIFVLESHVPNTDGMIVQAERGYRQGLLMYPKNPALLRSYAEFMQDIKLNPNASMRYWVEADKLEAQQTEVCVHAVVKSPFAHWLQFKWLVLQTSTPGVKVCFGLLFSKCRFLLASVVQSAVLGTCKSDMKPIRTLLVSMGT